MKLGLSINFLLGYLRAEQSEKSSFVKKYTFLLTKNYLGWFINHSQSFLSSAVSSTFQTENGRTISTFPGRSSLISNPNIVNDHDFFWEKWWISANEHLLLSNFVIKIPLPVSATQFWYNDTKIRTENELIRIRWWINLNGIRCRSLGSRFRPSSSFWIPLLNQQKQIIHS